MNTILLSHFLTNSVKKQAFVPCGNWFESREERNGCSIENEILLKTGNPLVKYIKYMCNGGLTFNYVEREMFNGLLRKSKFQREKGISYEIESVHYSQKISTYLYSCHESSCVLHNCPVLSCALEGYCQWQKLGIRINCSKLMTIDFTNVRHLRDLLFLNKMNFNFLTPFTHIEGTRKESLIDCLQKHENFDEKFPKMMGFIIESLLIREDGLSLVNKLIKKLKNPKHKIAVRNLLSKIFKIWPPPLWFYCLLKIRYEIRTCFKKTEKWTYLDIKESISDLITPQSYTLDLFSVVNLSYYHIWIDENFKYGLFETLQC